MNILVTGANGFLGSHLVEHLLERGDDVVALVRPGADTAWLDGVMERITLRRATLDDGPAVTRACEGVEVVCHIAGATKARPESRYRDINVGGTRDLLAACRANHGPTRLVLCSSLSAGGPATQGHPKREDDVDRPASLYGASKKAAEETIFGDAGALEVVALRPGPIYGPRDTYVLELLKPAARGFFLRVGGDASRYNFCHVSDVAAAFGQACRAQDVHGEALYIGDDTNYAPAEFEAILAEAVGSRPRLVLNMPKPLVTGVAELAERLTWWRAAPPPLNRDKARDIVAGLWSMDVSRAQTLLDWSPKVGLRAGMLRLAAWYRQQGWL